MFSVPNPIPVFHTVCFSLLLMCKNGHQLVNVFLFDCQFHWARECICLDAWILNTEAHLRQAIYGILNK